MTGIFNRFFKKEEVIDIEKLRLKSQLSVRESQCDLNMMRLGFQHQGVLDYFQKCLDIDTSAVHSLGTETALLHDFIRQYMAVKTDAFYVKVDWTGLDESALSVPVFLLFPLIQNAIRNGITSLEKYPIRIRGSVVDNRLRMEVSNRVNHYLENQEDNEIIAYFKARLALLFPENHSLLINSNSNVFKATLLLKLENLPSS